MGKLCIGEDKKIAITCFACPHYSQCYADRAIFKRYDSGYHTMRSAFKKWLELHDETCKPNFSSAPLWFSIEVKKACKYIYFIEDAKSCGRYDIYISYDFLRNLQRPEYKKEE